KLLTSSTKKDSNDSMMTEWYQPNISPEIFEILLSGKINIDESNIEKTLDYLIAADILWLHQLLEFLQTYLIRSHSAWIKANFVKVFHLMQLHPTTFKKLQQFCKMVLSTDSKNLNYRMAALQRNELIASSEQRSSNDEDFLSSPTFPTPTFSSEQTITITTYVS
ncbi:2990_t:CDS:2, partial [Gigaspora margarita]